MKIAVIGGTGLIGSQVVKILNASGHEAVPHSPSTGLDLLSDRGLPRALDGADVVVNLTNSPTFDDASPAFFHAMTDIVEFPPGDPGTPPHRHSGPCFGYVLEGEMVFELEGEPARVVRAGETFWEPGGDVIHYQDGNNRDDIPVRFTVTMLCEPGKPMLTFVDEEELGRRKDRRVPRTN
jgi:Cupin domain